MSEQDKQKFKSLLPAAHIAVFSGDKDTAAVVEIIKKDWRFARVKIALIDGDVKTAISQYQDEAAPDLVIVQSDDVNDAFTKDLEDLASVCEEGTAALVIGPDNDVNLYRRLIDMGVEDYLVRPVNVTDFSDVVGRVLIEQVGAGGSSLIAYVGAKGGVGCSSIAQAAAYGVADDLGQKTVFLDAAGGWSTASVGMGFETATTLAEAVKAAVNNDEDALGRMLYKLSDNLHVLSSGSESMLGEPISAESFEALIDLLMVTYPVVIVDLSGAPALLKRAALARSNHVNLVTTPTLSALRLARSLNQNIQDLRGGSDESLSLIVNNNGLERGLEVGKKDMVKVMEVKPSSVIDYAPKVFLAAESEGKKITHSKEGQEVLEAKILPVLKSVLAVKEMAVGSKKSNFLDGLLSHIKKDEG